MNDPQSLIPSGTATTSDGQVARNDSALLTVDWGTARSYVKGSQQHSMDTDKISIHPSAYLRFEVVSDGAGSIVDAPRLDTTFFIDIGTNIPGSELITPQTFLAGVVAADRGSNLASRALSNETGEIMVGFNCGQIGTAWDKLASLGDTILRPLKAGSDSLAQGAGYSIPQAMPYTPLKFKWKALNDVEGIDGPMSCDSNVFDGSHDNLGWTLPNLEDPPICIRLGDGLQLDARSYKDVRVEGQTVDDLTMFVCPTLISEASDPGLRRWRSGFHVGVVSANKDLNSDVKARLKTAVQTGIDADRSLDDIYSELDPHAQVDGAAFIAKLHQCGQSYQEKLSAIAQQAMKEVVTPFATLQKASTASQA